MIFNYDGTAKISGVYEYTYSADDGNTDPVTFTVTIILIYEVCEFDNSSLAESF